jgi:hypothetical protein
MDAIVRAIKEWSAPQLPGMVLFLETFDRLHLLPGFIAQHLDLGIDFHPSGALGVGGGYSNLQADGQAGRRHYSSRAMQLSVRL